MQYTFRFRARHQLFIWLRAWVEIWDALTSILTFGHGTYWSWRVMYFFAGIELQEAIKIKELP